MKTSTWRRGAIVLVLAGALLGCGTKEKGKAGGGGGGAASCNTPLGECTEYGQANRAIGDDYLKKLCVGFEGTFATTACPKAGQTGMCHKDEGTKIYYANYPMTAAELEKSCTDTGGHWMKP